MPINSHLEKYSIRQGFSHSYKHGVSYRRSRNAIPIGYIVLVTERSAMHIMPTTQHSSLTGVYAIYAAIYSTRSKLPVREGFVNETTFKTLAL